MISLLLIDVQGLPQRSWQTHVFCLHEVSWKGVWGRHGLLAAGLCQPAKSKHHRPGEGSTCLLPRLVGHEESLLSLVADFLGIVRGRELRNAREAIEHFEE